MVAQSHDLGENAVVVRAHERRQGERDKRIKAKLLPRAHLSVTCIQLRLTSFNALQKLCHQLGVKCSKHEHSSDVSFPNSNMKRYPNGLTCWSFHPQPVARLEGE